MQFKIYLRYYLSDQLGQAMEICAVQRLEGSNSLVMPLNSFVSGLKADYFLNIYLVETTVWKSVSK